MQEFLSAIPFTYMALFPVLNPLGGAFIILSMTLGISQPVYRQLCRKIAINTFILLVAVFFLGTSILEFFGITIPIVQIAGGVVVGLIGWQMLNQSSFRVAGINTTTKEESSNILNSAFYPFTMPLTAGPGSIAVILTLSAHETVRRNMHMTILEQAGAVVGIFLGALTIYLCYRYADSITRRLGENGTNVIMRLLAFIIFCIGLQICWHGIETLITSLTNSN